MRIFVRSTSLPVSADEAWAWHSRPGAFERLTPPWQHARVLHREGDFEHLRATIEIRVGPVTQRWVAQHRDAEPGRMFIDEQVSGPMRSWVHRHEFLGDDDACTLRDAISWEAPLGALGEAVGGFAVEAMLDRLFRFRHARTVHDLSRHAAVADQPRLRIAISGATGLVGTALCAYLATAGHTVLRLVRSARPREGEIAWDPAKGQLDPAALEGVDAVINLSGANIAERRWTPERKTEILRSRVDSTALLARTLAGLHRKPSVFLSMSATGWYGDSGEMPCPEHAPPGGGFLGEVAAAWESAADPARDAGIRVVHPRLGPVIAGAGGMLAATLPIFRLGGGGPIGSGQMFVPWISLDDTLAALEFLLHRSDVAGPVNLCAPNPVRQGDYASMLGAVLHRPAFVPVPEFAIRAMMGEMGRELLLGGQRARPDTLLARGFAFAHPSLDDALKFELGV